MPEAPPDSVSGTAVYQSQTVLWSLSVSHTEKEKKKKKELKKTEQTSFRETKQLV